MCSVISATLTWSAALAHCGVVCTRHQCWPQCQMGGSLWSAESSGGKERSAQREWMAANLNVIILVQPNVPWKAIPQSFLNHWIILHRVVRVLKLQTSRLQDNSNTGHFQTIVMEVIYHVSVNDCLSRIHWTATRVTAPKQKLLLSRKYHICLETAWSATRFSNSIAKCSQTSHTATKWNKVKCQKYFIYIQLCLFNKGNLSGLHTQVWELISRWSSLNSFAIFIYKAAYTYDRPLV